MTHFLEPRSTFFVWFPSGVKLAISKKDFLYSMLMIQDASNHLDELCLKLQKRGVRKFWDAGQS